MRVEWSEYRVDRVESMNRIESSGMEWNHEWNDRIEWNRVESMEWNRIDESMESKVNEERVIVKWIRVDGMDGTNNGME